jgi:hypothetical protein
MLRQAKDIAGYKLRARDGDIGEAKEFYFDDHHWTVRYLVADTGGWLTGRQVLISPHALGAVNEVERVLPVDLTRKQIEESPPLESDQPVSQQYETEFSGYYGWPYYGIGPYLWGGSPYPYAWGAIPAVVGEHEDRMDKEEARRVDAWDPNLRSTEDVAGHYVQALDGEIGHVEDFIIDDKTWTIRYLVVDTVNWWPGKHVLVSPQWIERVSWEESKVFVNLPLGIIRRSPPYTPEALNRGYETELYQLYDRRGYWVDEPVAKGR